MTMFHIGAANRSLSALVIPRDRVVLLDPRLTPTCNESGKRSRSSKGELCD